MNYPNGIRKKSLSTPRKAHNRSYSNRGMTLEDDINATNEFYASTDKAIVHKKPTPIQIVKVHYPKRSAAVITEAYFQEKSTTDYNGIYRGKHLDFEAKETKNKTLFPLANFHEHQFNHMQSILNQGGISFVIIRFTLFQETYFLSAQHLLSYWENMKKGGRKSISYETIQKNGYLIPFKYQARVDYLNVIDQLFF